MKPFDLERALAGDPIICRDGKVPSEWHYFKTVKEDENSVIYCCINGVIYEFNKYGQFINNSDNDNEKDLFMAPKKIKLWVNIYKAEDNQITGFAHDSQEGAKLYQNGNGYIKTQEIEVEV